MKNSSIEDILREDDRPKRFISMPLIIGTVFAILYLYALFFGDSSLKVFFNTKWDKNELDREFNRLQEQNQDLQKRYFELIQLTPDATVF